MFETWVQIPVTPPPLRRSWKTLERKLLRFSRQKKLLPQEKLSKSAVAIVGLGGVGLPAASYLAGAGVGRIFLIDRDVIEESNLNRQLLYSEKDLGGEKAHVAKRALLSIAPKSSEIKSIVGDENALLKIRPDIVLDCTDSIDSRAKVASISWKRGIPCVLGSASGWAGSVAAFVPPKGFCFSCFSGKLGGPAEESCLEKGIVGPVSGAIGSIQACEALKIIAGQKAQKGVRYFDFLSGKSWFVRVSKNKSCPVCGKMETAQGRLSLR